MPRHLTYENPSVPTAKDPNHAVPLSQVEEIVGAVVSGATGSFTSADGKTVTETDGVITSIT